MSGVTRRHLLGAGSAGLATAGWAGGAGAARAAEQGADRTGRNPPVYRTRIGSAEITIVSDGTIGFPPAMVLPEVPEAELEAFLAARYQPLDNLPLQLNAMVADIGGRRVLIDTGCGAKFDPTAGRLPENLRAAGIEPASIDAVVVTHLHPDHFWGATDAANSEAVFENAEIVVPAAELDFWSDRELAPAMPEGLFREVAEGTHAHLRRLDDRLRPVEAPGEAVPGIRFVPTPGHTPGHASLMIESDGEALMSTGDAVADPFVSVERPDWQFLTDWDAETAVTTRRALLAQAADERMRVFGFHMPWPGFGHVARQGDAFRWIPEKWVWDT
jgi:glyoxylase-like metal-dependent hydrolase (beta-lactamase superfamily II)